MPQAKLGSERSDSDRMWLVRLRPRPTPLGEREGRARREMRESDVCRVVLMFASALVWTAPSPSVAAANRPSGFRTICTIDPTCHVAGTVGTSCNGQSESRHAVFTLENRTTLMNVTLNRNAADGIRCRGNCSLINVRPADVSAD